MTHDTGVAAPALTADEWRDLDYRPPAREIDAWARGELADGERDADSHEADDATQYVAKIGITKNACVLAMSRAHDYVVVPPPARRALAALAMHGQPFGFSMSDVNALRRAADAIAAADQAGNRVAAVLAANELRDVASRIEALVEH